MIRFLLNEKTIATDLPPGMVLLDFIRYHQHMMGTKIGCREGDCGACTVLVGEIKEGELHYESMTCCLMPLGNAHGKHIVTIEGINYMNGLNPIQQAMADEGATQCGFCTPGFVMSLAGFCLRNKEATQKNAIAAIDGNICRCTGYKSIERAADKVASLLKNRNDQDPAIYASDQKILPEYFASIKTKLQSFENGLPTSARRTANKGGALDSKLPASDSEFPTQLVGGGTDLYVQKQDEMTHAEIQFFFDDPQLIGIKKEGNKCILGASTTVTDLKESPIIKEYFPAFDRYAKLVSSTPIRNMATVAGNFINASPIGDFTIFFLALDAEVTLAPLSSGEGSGVRLLPLRRLYKGYKQLDKKPGEYIEEIRFELPGKNSLFHFEKVSKRTHLDIASVNSAICLRMKGDMIEKAGLSAGGVGPIPLFLEKTSNHLIGKTIDEELVQEVIEIAQTEISPISDARGAKEYKSLLLGQLIKAHFLELFPKLKVEKLLNAI